MYFMVAKDKKIKMIHTGIASFVAVLRLAFRWVCIKESPTGRYVLGNGGSPIDVNPWDVQ